VSTAGALLEMQAIGKSFPGVRALDGVSFNVFPGEIHALVGENGAGKSTLMKILGGVYPAGEHDGRLLISGTEQSFAGVRDAENAGVAIVFQELSLVPQLSVAENIFLGRLPHRYGITSWAEAQHRARTLLASLDADFPVDAPVGALGIAQQQLVEIAKALSHAARILVLDEPTAALSEADAQTLISVLRKLRSQGLGLIYISHRLPEVLALADRITVLRDGRSVATRARTDLNADQLIRLMVGRELTQVFPQRPSREGPMVLELRNVSVEHPAIPDRRVLHNISFQLKAGEVLGIAGLMGSGRTALMNVLFGSFPESATGEVLISGKPSHLRSPGEAIRHGIALVTEDRKRLGLSLTASVLENTTLAALKNLSFGPFLRKQREIAAVEQAMSQFRIKASSPETAVGTLSGGNQQKVVLARWLLTGPRILLLDEPTRGIDIAARQEIYQHIASLAEQGRALIVVSSELEELIGLCDRILVMHEGRINGELLRSDATPERIMACATGSFATT
jgi:D-xylose transport system ATP-binding protein